MSNSEFNELSTSEFTFKHSDLTTEQTINESISQNINQNGGGIIEALFGKNELNTLLLETFTDGRPDIACYLLCKQKKCKCDVTEVDNTGRNLLHYMSIYASHGNMVIHIGKLFKNCSKSKLKKALKCKDKLGNTPLHYATELGFNNLVKLYIDNGADPSIRNNKGEYVMEESQNQPIDVSIIVASPQQGEVLFTPTESFNTEHFIREVEHAIVQHPNINQDRNQDRNQDYRDLVNLVDNQINDSINNIDETTILTEDIIKQIITKTDKLTNLNHNEEEKREKKREENIDVKLDEILNRVKHNNLSSDTTESYDRHRINEINDFFMHKGGAKKTKKSKKNSKNKSKNKSKNLGRLIVGERRLVTYTEMTVSDKGVSDDNKNDNKYDKYDNEEVKIGRIVASDDSDVSDIAREISRQSSDIHERVVMKIVELLKLDKSNEKDVLKARNYKAAIYRMVKEKNPLLNNFDRAVEMEKSITKDVLKSIDIDKVTKEIEKYKSDIKSSTKSLTQSSTISTKSDSETISATSESVKSKKTKEKKTKEKKTKKTKKTKDDDGILSIEFSTISAF